MSVTTYREAAAFLAGGRGPKGLPCLGRAVKGARSTRIERRGPDAIAMKYHDTDVVTWSPHAVKLDDGHWRTVTTKARMNDGLPAPWSVISDKGAWWIVKAARDEGCYGENAQRFPYQRGVEIMWGKVRGAATVKQLRRDAGMRKSVLTWGKAFVDALYEEKVPPPSLGDCFYCLMKTDEGKPLGETFHDAGHVRSHVMEAYYVPSFAVRAVELYGGKAAMDVTRAKMIMSVPKHVQHAEAVQVVRTWCSERDGRKGWAPKQIERAIVKHAFRCLGMVAR